MCLSSDLTGEWVSGFYWFGGMCKYSVLILSEILSSKQIYSVMTDITNKWRHSSLRTKLKECRCWEGKNYGRGTYQREIRHFNQRLIVSPGRVKRNMMQGSWRKRNKCNMMTEAKSFRCLQSVKSQVLFRAVTVKAPQLFSHYYYKSYVRCVVSSFLAGLLKSVTS